MSGASAVPLRLKLPATSANLGPGFDALGLAMNFHLHVKAEAAERSTVTATGRNQEIIQRLDDNLVLSTYREVLAARSVAEIPLALRIDNEIPLGMGCGSSAAALVAGVAMADHFGQLGWSCDQILTEASRREGHPDNVAACIMGGLTVSAMHGAGDASVTVSAVSLRPAANWNLLLALPQTSFSTKTARALLPEIYSKADAVANVQNASLLTAAFAAGRGDLLLVAMQDRLHQPYRSTACPLLPVLLPLVASYGVLGVALSGAGPSVLLILDEAADTMAVTERVQEAASAANIAIETLLTEVGGPAVLQNTATR